MDAGWCLLIHLQSDGFGFIQATGEVVFNSSELHGPEMATATSAPPGGRGVGFVAIPAAQTAGWQAYQETPAVGTRTKASKHARQLRHHLEHYFGPMSCGFLSSIPPHSRRGTHAAECPCILDADMCLLAPFFFIFSTITSSGRTRAAAPRRRTG